MCEMAETPEKQTESENKKNKQAKESLIKTVFPNQANAVFYSAIAIGLVLIAASIFFLYTNPGIRLANPDLRVQCNLLISVGAGIILAAFGSQATVRVGRVVMAGAAAVASIIFWRLEAISERDYADRIAELKSTYVKGVIRRVDPEEVSGFSMESDVDFLGNLAPTGKLYAFAIFGDLPEIDTQTVFMDLNSVEPNEFNSEEPRDFVIDTSCLEKTSGVLRKLDWKIVRETVVEGGEEVAVPAIFDNKENAIISINSAPGETRACTSHLQAALEPSGVHTPWFRLVSHAIAQTFSAKKPPSQAELNEALRNLTSNVTAVRRNARSTLSLAPVSFVPTILDAMQTRDGREQDSYRRILGGSVALTLMLRRDKSAAGEIQSKLDGNDLDLLLKATAHQDRTMRVYATEFLYDLGDTRVTEKALPLALRTRDEKARYNYVFVSQGGWKKLSRNAKRELAPVINQLKSASGSQTVKLLGAFS
jgi:hypothetical protein